MQFASMSVDQIQQGLKAGDFSAPQELAALCMQLYENPQVRYCPHGRPVFVVLKRREIEKQFGRI